MVTMGDCAAKITAKSLDDLSMGLGFFGKIAQLFMCTARIGAVKDTQAFVPKLESPNDA